MRRGRKNYDGDDDGDDDAYDHNDDDNDLAADDDDDHDNDDADVVMAILLMMMMILIVSILNLIISRILSYTFLVIMIVVGKSQFSKKCSRFVRRGCFYLLKISMVRLPFCSVLCLAFVSRLLSLVLYRFSWGLF